MVWDVEWEMWELEQAAGGHPDTATAKADLRAAIRAEKIRAVLACQWGVAVALVQRRQFFCGDYRCGGLSGAEATARDIAALPTAEEIVDGVTP